MTGLNQDLYLLQEKNIEEILLRDDRFLKLLFLNPIINKNLPPLSKPGVDQGGDGGAAAAAAQAAASSGGAGGSGGSGSGGGSGGSGGGGGGAAAAQNNDDTGGVHQEIISFVNGLNHRTLQKFCNQNNYKCGAVGETPIVRGNLIRYIANNNVTLEELEEKYDTFSSGKKNNAAAVGSVSRPGSSDMGSGSNAEEEEEEEELEKEEEDSVAAARAIAKSFWRQAFSDHEQQFSNDRLKESYAVVFGEEVSDAVEAGSGLSTVDFLERFDSVDNLDMFNLPNVDKGPWKKNDANEDFLNSIKKVLSKHPDFKDLSLKNFVEDEKKSKEFWEAPVPENNGRRARTK